MKYVQVGGWKSKTIRYAVVDSEDFEKVNSIKWTLFRTGKNEYAGYQKYPQGRHHKATIIWLHRLILSPPSGFEIDHINGDGLDCRRGNLRPCQRRNNSYNRKPTRNSISKFKGVSWNKSVQKWMATIQKDGKSKYLGYFQREEEAAKAYDSAALFLFGEFAWLNFPDEGHRQNSFVGV